MANKFTATLPVPEANDVKAMLKDPYIFDMLTFTDQYNERDVEIYRKTCLYNSTGNDDGDTTDFFINEPGQERDHGAYSCACIGGYLSSGDTIKGLAWNAEYYLAKIDDFDTELRIEEERIMNAIRWLLS